MIILLECIHFLTHIVLGFGFFSFVLLNTLSTEKVFVCLFSKIESQKIAYGRCRILSPSLIHGVSWPYYIIIFSFSFLPRAPR